MKNKILLDVIEKRKGHYCHALEVNDIHELKACIEGIYDEFIKDNYSIEEIIEFFDSIELYCLDNDNEREVYNFDIKKYLKQF